MTAVPAGRNPSPDPGSVADFYAATVERTFATARRVAGDRDVAWDATQEAYVVMVDRWSERSGRSLTDNRRYVIGIAVNKVIDWYRRHGSLSPLGDEGDRAVTEDGYARILDQLTVFKEVRLLLERQPVGLRTVGILHFLEGLEYKEIAEIRGVSASTVRSQVQRLRDQLRPLVNRLAELTETGEQP